jgi:hypothetical protein
VIELGYFGFGPGFEQLSLRAARSTFQIQKAQSGSGRTSNPPFGSSAVKLVRLVTLDRDRSRLRQQHDAHLFVARWPVYIRIPPNSVYRAGGVTDTSRRGAGRAGAPGTAARRGRGEDQDSGAIEWAQYVETVV